MRLGALLLVGLGFVATGACTTTTVVDGECISNGGLCFSEVDPGGCAGGPIPYGCQTGYQCCATVYAANFNEGGILADVSNGAPLDAGSDALPDAGVDGARTVDAGPTDASLDGAHEGATSPADADADAAKDATTHD